MRQAAQAYFETQVTTTSQGQILLMLYDGAVKFLNQAKEYIVEKNYAQKGIYISKALDVINELSSSLNAERGGDLAANLNQLYFYCSKRLFTANLKMDTGAIDEVIKILNGLRSAFAEIVDDPEAVAAAQAAASSRAMVAPNRNQPAPISQNAPGVGTSNAKAQGAYSLQGQQTTGGQQAVAEAQGIAAAIPVEKEEPLTAEPTIMPVPPPSVSAAAKRMAASSLYQKFAGQ